jgi:hypothetical protein
VLGCMDKKEAFAIPLTELRHILPNLNQTIKPDKTYWHIALTTDDGSIKLNLSKVGQLMDLTSYRFELI